MNTNRMIPVAFAIAVMTVAGMSQALASETHHGDSMEKGNISTLPIPSSRPFHVWNEPSSSNLTLQQARQMVQQEFKGKITDGKMLGFDSSNGSQLMYDFTLKNGSKIEHVMVDAKTGKIDSTGKAVAMTNYPSTGGFAVDDVDIYE